MLQPPSQSATDKLSADDFAKSFVDKVAKIRASTAAAAAPVIIPRDVLPLAELEPTSVHEINKLLSTVHTACKVLLFGPNTHLIAQAHLSYCLYNTMSPLQPVISAWHFSQSTEARSALMTPRLTLDPDTASSYRPISNLSFISKRAMSTYTLCFQPNNSPTDRSTLY